MKKAVKEKDTYIKPELVLLCVEDFMTQGGGELSGYPEEPWDPAKDPFEIGEGYDF